MKKTVNKSLHLLGPTQVWWQAYTSCLLISSVHGVCTDEMTLKKHVQHGRKREARCGVEREHSERRKPQEQSVTKCYKMTDTLRSEDGSCHSLGVISLTVLSCFNASSRDGLLWMKRMWKFYLDWCQNPFLNVNSSPCLHIAGLACTFMKSMNTIVKYTLLTLLLTCVK